MNDIYYRNEYDFPKSLMMKVLDTRYTEETIDKIMSRKYFYTDLDSALKTLSNRELFCISSIYGFMSNDGKYKNKYKIYPYTSDYEDLANKLNLSKETIFKTCEKAIRKLRRVSIGFFLIGQEYINRHNKEILDSIVDYKGDNILIEDIGFTVKTYRLLHRAGINDIKILSKMTKQDLMRIEHLGLQRLNEIVDVLRARYNIIIIDENNILNNRYPTK